MVIEITVKDVAVYGFVVGFVGDLFLNLFTQNLKILDAGLINYFPRHGTFEAACIAGGLVAITVYVGLSIWELVNHDEISNIKLEYTFVYIFLFGAFVDNFFRFLHLMPTLNGMYEKLSPPVSMFFAGSPLVAALGLAVVFNQQEQPPCLW